MIPRIAVATCADVPDLADDGPVLLAAFAAAGQPVDVLAWDRTDVDWRSYDLVLVRSTWDYTWRPEAFLAWAAGCRTVNPSAVIRWNADKHYLGDLARAGVPVVETTFLEPGESLAGSPGAGRIVVKPAVSAGARDTGRFAHDDPAAAALVQALHAGGRSVLVQPFLDRVDAAGETALVYLDGEFSHAARKPALLRGSGPGAVLDLHVMVDLTVGTTASAAELAVAEAALAAVPVAAPLAYARVDLLPGPDGRPVLLELELVEPDLFLRLAHDPARAAARLVAATSAALG